MRPLLAVIALVLVAIAISALVSRPNNGKTYAPTEEPTLSKTVPSRPAVMPSPDPERAKIFEKYKDGAIHVTLVVENRGTMVLELYPKAAPKTVAHFVDLCKKHFYDGIKFHRVEPGFVVQGGDPKSKDLDPGQFSANGIGSNGSGTTVPLEAKLPHIPGSVGLARANDPNSGDSQFYINLKDNADLDGNYCVFGRVIQGADVAPKIQIGDRITSLTVS
jgi:peptidyl-prolyl cis-trans isomerase B (cyclophilin B)